MILSSITPRVLVGGRVGSLDVGSFSGSRFLLLERVIEPSASGTEELCTTEARKLLGDRTTGAEAAFAGNHVPIKRAA